MKKKKKTKLTQNRKRLNYQIYRAQEKQNCYKKFISQEQTYAPAKFRIKINKNKWIQK